MPRRRFYAEWLRLRDESLPYFHDVPEEERAGVADARLRRLLYRRLALSWHPALDLGAETTPPEAVRERWETFLDGWPYALSGEEPGVLTPDALAELCEQGAARKRDGVYYTAPDVAAYICASTILPALLRGVYTPDAAVFRVGDADAYLQPSLLKEEPLPLETAWEREQRLRRVAEVRRFGPQCLDDWITLTRDLPRRTEEIIAGCDAETLPRLWRRLTTLRVLDPTCGSGAFLIAAMETLAPLYSACLSAMERQQGCPAGAEFRPVMAAAREAGSLAAFARGEALRNNLYGMDLMPAAVETTAMRLLLRVLAASPSALPDEFEWRGNLRVGDALQPWEGSFPELSGGFDLVIGNPPYVRRTPDSTLPPDLHTAACPNVYAPVVERALRAVRADGWCGVIVPVSAISGEEYRPLMALLRQRDLWTSSFSNRPGKLFPGVEQRLAILLSGPACDDGPRVYAAPYAHWWEEERPFLFQRLQYVQASTWERSGMPVKSGTPEAESVWRKLAAQRGTLADWTAPGEGAVWLHDAPTYWVRALPFSPGDPSAHYHCLCTATQGRALALAAVLSSSLYYFFFKLVSNCRDLGYREWALFPLDTPPPAMEAALAALGARLGERLRETSALRERRYPESVSRYRECYPSRAVEIIDEIDAVLAPHYGLTAEELEYVRQRDRKYRLGRSRGYNGAEEPGR